MFTRRRLLLFSHLLVTVVICWLIFTFVGNERVTILSIYTLKIAILIFSFICFLKAFLSVRRLFWLLFSIGAFFYLCSDLIFLYFNLGPSFIQFAEPAYISRFIAYLFFLGALIYNTKKISLAVSKSYNFFNILIFIVTVTAISIYYLVKLPLTLLHHSLFITIISLGFFIVDLSILFVNNILFSLTHSSQGKWLYLLINTGFFLQIAADMSFAFLSFKHWEVVNILWLFALLFIGHASFYAKAEPRWEIEKHTKIKAATFPYFSIAILILLCVISYHWAFNALSLGVLIDVIMLMVRQVIMSKKHENLVDEYKYLAYHDPLTGLENRVSFHQKLDLMIAKNNIASVALFLIDLDRFKVINDTLGHHTGDSILIKTADRLCLSLESEPAVQVFRIGGDEFTVLLPKATVEKCSRLAETIIEHFQKPFWVEENGISVTPSIGISMFPKNGDSSEELLKQADAAMYLVKEHGKNSFVFYNHEIHKIMERKMVIENELRKAMDARQLYLYYQPKIDLQTRRLIGMEALLRWKHPELGWISPVEFIPIAEETGQIVSIGEWVLKTACVQNKSWQEKGLPSLTVSVNVSVRQFEHSHFLSIVERALQETGLHPKFLELEITESIMQNTRESLLILKGLRKMGVKTSIDDFGTGYSSLHILQNLPVDTLKIDKSFIDNIRDHSKQSMVKTIIDLGLNLHLSVVAEGIEDEYQLKVLIENKCSIGQGFLFSKPIDPQKFEQIFLAKDFIA